MLQEVLNDWNPWWKEGNVRGELTGIKRAGTAAIEKSLAESEITVLIGPRRSGKTTIMHQLIAFLISNGTSLNQMFYINLDDESFIGISLEEIYLTYKKNINPTLKTYFFIDEIQGSDGWQKWLKKMYDLKAEIKFTISGSNANLLSGEYSTLLTGRILKFEVLPLSFAEFISFRGIKIPEPNLIGTADKIEILHALEEFAATGGYPAIVFKDSYFKKLVLKEYFDGIVHRDLIARFGLNEKKFVEFVHYLLTNFTSPISYRKLMKTLGLTYNTLIGYLNYAEKAYLIFQLNYFSYSLAEQLANNKKIYCIDTGIRNAVCFKFSDDLGKLLENIVFVELKRRFAETYYWKDTNEVDFVIKNGDNSLTAINVTYGDEVPEREKKALLQFKERFTKVRDLIILTMDIEQEKERIRYIPAWKWLLELR